MASKKYNSYQNLLFITLEFSNTGKRLKSQ